MRYIPILVVAIALSTWAMADTPAADDVPQSPAAQAAMVRASQQIGDAEAVYHKAIIAARTEEIEALKKTEAAVMVKKDLPEANRIDAIMKKAQAEIDGASDTDIVGMAFRWKGDGATVHYSENGVVTATAWQKPGKWRAIDANTIEQIEPDGKLSHITFSPDRRAAVWVFSDGSIGWSVRQQ